MNKNVTPILLVFLFFIYVNTVEAQVVKKQANKKQLINGERILPDQTKNLIKVSPVSILSTEKKQKNNIKYTKNKKPIKVSKYGKKPHKSKPIKREENE